MTECRPAVLWPVPCPAKSLWKNQQIYGGAKTVHVMFPIGKIKLNSTTESDKHTLHEMHLTIRVKTPSYSLLYKIIWKDRKHF